jgi:hypothetical protein
MPQPLTREEQWSRLKTWLAESIAAVERGDLERLPSSFTGERAEAAKDAYKSCQQAMTFLEQWDVYGLPRDSSPQNTHK